MLILNNETLDMMKEVIIKYQDIIVKLFKIGCEDEELDVDDLEQMRIYLEYNWIIFIDNIEELNNGTTYPTKDIYNEIFELFAEDENYYILSYCPSSVIHVVIPKELVAENLEFKMFMKKNLIMEKL